MQGPTVVVMDNASIHTSEAFQEEIPKWEKKGLSIFYLPKYSPELNLIEILWRFMKYAWIEFWAYTSFAHLVQYVEEVIKNFGEQYKINFV
jgi:transposase